MARFIIKDKEIASDGSFKNIDIINIYLRLKLKSLFG